MFVIIVGDQSYKVVTSICVDLKSGLWLIRKKIVDVIKVEKSSGYLFAYLQNFKYIWLLSKEKYKSFSNNQLFCKNKKILKIVFGDLFQKFTVVALIFYS